MAVRFYLEKRTDKNGDAPIRVSISIDGKRLVTSSGFKISPTKWNEENQQVKRGSLNYNGETFTTINARLKEIDALFASLESDLKLGKIEDFDIKTVYAENFRQKADVPEVEEKTITDYIEEFTSEVGRRNTWSIAVHKKFTTLSNHLNNFNSTLVFDDLTEDCLTNFVEYLRTKVVVGGAKTASKDTREYGLRDSTVKKLLDLLKWFLRWATEKGYNTNLQYQVFSPKLRLVDNQIVFLTWEELMNVYNYHIPESKQYLIRVRDIFCFCCFTSLRYSDVANLKRTAVKDSHIEVTTIKTDDRLTIDLNDYSREILKKYENEVFDGGLALPIITNQRMNEYLKELGEMCGIDEPITITYFKGSERFDEVYPKYALISSHTARRTFISNAIMMGIAPQVVMKFTGHSDYKAMKPYIDIADKAKAEAMALFNKK